MISGSEGQCARAEKAAVLTLCASAVAGPVVLGATGPWFRLAVEMCMALAVALWALASARSRLVVLMPLTFAGMLCVQSLPLPESVLAIVAPVSNAAWKIARAGQGNHWATISVDPATTAKAVWRMLLILSTLTAVTDLSRYSWCRKAFTASLAIVCVSIWALGIAFPFDKSLVLLGFIDCRGPIEAEFWKTPLVAPIATNGSGNLDWVTVAGNRYATATWIAADGFGPYIYANHFAGAMCMTLPVLLGGLLTAARGRLPALFQIGVVGSLFAFALWTVGVMATSRAGAAALVLGGLAFCSLTLAAGWPRAIARTAALFYGVMLVGFMLSMFGAFTGIEKWFPAEIQPRIVALLSDGRTVAGRVAFRMFAASPFFGVGLGTFGELFPNFFRGDMLLAYAHNDYAQWLAETGLVGAGIALAIAWPLLKGFVGVLQSVNNRDTALLAGPWAALAALSVHSFFDWNLHIPANALLACMVAGLAGASGGSDSRPLVPKAECKAPLPQRWPGFVLAAACILAMCFLARDAMTETTQRRLREAIVAARLQATDDTQPPAGPALRAAIDAGERMARWDSRNAHLALLIGKALLHLSAEEQPIGDASRQRAAAERWFETARAHCAVCRGLPESVTAAASPRTP